MDVMKTFDKAMESDVVDVYACSFTWDGEGDFLFHFDFIDPESNEEGYCDYPISQEMARAERMTPPIHRFIIGDLEDTIVKERS